MKKSYIIIPVLFFIFCFTATPSYGQGYIVTYGGRLAGVDEGERHGVFTEIAKEAVLKYAPEYYREYRKPYIYGESVFYTGIEELYSFACVTFFYDPTKESMKEDFAAAVIIDNQAGYATDILLGNGILLKDINLIDGGVPTESVPWWSPGYRRDEVSRADQLKNELLWGWNERDNTRRRQLMEKTFISDSLDTEINKVHESRRFYNSKEGPASQISSESREQKIDSLRHERSRLIEEQRKSWKSYEEKGI